VKRKPFLLLEVMIAVVLIGTFSFVSLQGLYRMFNMQKTMVRALEYARLVDLERMDIVEKYWNQVEALAEQDKPIIVQTTSKTTFEVKCQSHPESKYYLLEINELRPKEFCLKHEKRPAYKYFVSHFLEPKSVS